MITISVCMIVKNEADKLSTCLDSLRGIADEIIVVDTGSTDDTKIIAKNYTDKVVDFEWTGSFSDARNYAFSLATGDYIYSADADEELDADNQIKFLELKKAMLSEIDIVQMYYCNQLENNTIYSYDRELRPKLYKRLRTFRWEEAIHEAVALEPLVYDSDIDIIHRPGPGHAARDLRAFEKQIEKDGRLSKRLIEIYAKELIIAGEKDNYLSAKAYFSELADTADMSNDDMARVFTIAAKCCRMAGDIPGFMKYALRAAAGELMTSELCFELGDYYESIGDINEALMWYYNAANETESYMDIKYSDEYPNNAINRIQNSR